MADNGHCSTCQTHNSASDCGSSIQSFKNIFGSSVSANETDIKLNNIYPAPEAQTTYITNEIFNTLKDILSYVKDYGEQGTFNPTNEKINNITTVQDGQQINLSLYNSILSALDKQTLSESSIITASMINNLNAYIKQYNLNDDRCNICNTACQNCQGHVAECDCMNCNCDCERYACPPARHCPPACFNSSRVLKENIQIFNKKALELIASTNIVSFNYINDKEKNYKVGFIAEDTDEILASKNHNVMDMYNCIGILLKAVQELSQEIEQLKNNK